MIMKNTILILIVLVCLAAVPLVTAAGDYMGGDIVLGGSGPKQITQVTGTGTVATTAAVPVQPTTGSLSVTTSPPGAAVFLDGVQKGISPVTIPGIVPGRHALFIKMDGYADYTEPITVQVGQTLMYSATLSLPGTAAATPAPIRTKAPGFEAACGLAALGAVLCIRKITR